MFTPKSTGSHFNQNTLAVWFRLSKEARGEVVSGSAIRCIMLVARACCICVYNRL
jgi:hypothetical protein